MAPALLMLKASLTYGQCISHVVHTFPGVCEEGTIWLECFSPPDSIVWANGTTGLAITGPPGTYPYQAYSAGEVVSSGEPAIEAHGWVFGGPNSYSTVYGFQLSGSASVAYCGTSNWNFPCCAPDDVSILLIQDGTTPITGPCIGCIDYPCSGGAFMFSQLPYGHEYCVRLVDPACAGIVEPESLCVIAPNCANLSLVTTVQASIPGGSTGVIELIEAIPDTTEVYPIFAPVSGASVLYHMPGYEQVNPVQDGTSAIWTALDTGYYLLQFTPVAMCQVQEITLYVPAGTNTSVPLNQVPDLAVSPTVTDGDLYLSCTEASTPVRLRIVDGRGRTVSSALRAAGRFSIQDLAPGPYLILAEQGEQQVVTRIVKR